MHTNHYNDLADPELVKTAIGFLSANQPIPDDLKDVITVRGFWHFFDQEDGYYVADID